MPQTPVAKSLLAAALLAAVVASAQAETFFGHEVAIREPDGSGPKQLVVDGRILIESWDLIIDRTEVVQSTGVLIGFAGPGGNACEAAPFVVSFVKGLAPRIDGPVEACHPVEVTVTEQAILLNEFATPGYSGGSWRWTPEEGLVVGKDTVFRATDDRGWNAVRERSITHPGELIANIELRNAIRGLLGAKASEFETIAAGVGSAGYRDDWLVGRTCVPHMCGQIESLIAVDIPSRRIYIAWKPQDEPIVVVPPVGEWPATARGELRSWAETWK